MAALRSKTADRRLPWSRQRGSAAERPPAGEGGAPATAAPSSRPGPLLDVSDLKVTLRTEGGAIEAVRGISLSIDKGETIGIVGESGSGKTMLALSFLGLLPGAARVSGSVRLDGQELLASSQAQWQRVRGDRVAMVFQDPMTALNPMYTIGWQVAECVRLHRKTDRAVASARAVELLDAVGLPEPELMARRYPHELSGGMRQRVVIAMAIANEPELLIADEPTTALDVTVQAQILDLLRSIRAQTGAAMILISHDLGVVAGVADRVLVMYAGQAVEVGSTDDVFSRPQMPYTTGLLASLPSLDRRSERLASIPGTPPSGIGYGPGCAFAPRCPIAAQACSQQPALATVGPSHQAACHFAGSAPAWPAATGQAPDLASAGLASAAWPATLSRTSSSGSPTCTSTSVSAAPGSARCRPSRRWPGSTSSCGPGAASRWSASQDAASRRWAGCCSGSRNRHRAASR